MKRYAWFDISCFDEFYFSKELKKNIAYISEWKETKNMWIF